MNKSEICEETNKLIDTSRSQDFFYYKLWISEYFVSNIMNSTSALY